MGALVPQAPRLPMIRPSGGLTEYRAARTVAKHRTAAEATAAITYFWMAGITASENAAFDMVADTHDHLVAVAGGSPLLLAYAEKRLQHLDRMLSRKIENNFS